GAVRMLETMSAIYGDVYTASFWTYMVWNRHPWDWKRVPGGSQDYGNFFYGATGRAVGFPTPILLAGAAVAQRMFGHAGTGPLGDNPDDPPFIRAGAGYFDQGCAK